MEKKFKFGVIGAGFMSTAIVKGIINSNFIPSSDILVSDVSKENLNKIATLGVNTTNCNNTVLSSCEYVLFAVKPQSLGDVLSSIIDRDNKKIISIMAGVKKQRFSSFFSNSKICRCMPNTPCAISSGAIAIDCSDYTLKDDIDFIKGIFSCIANVVFVEEEKLNAVTGISGSSPAYFYQFVKSLVSAGVKNGIDYNDSLNLVVSTMIGAGKMILENQDKTIDELITAVCSKGGTTIEAMKTFEREGLDKIVDNAVTACINRAKELESL